MGVALASRSRRWRSSCRGCGRGRRRDRSRRACLVSRRREHRNPPGPAGRNEAAIDRLLPARSKVETAASIVTFWRRPGRKAWFTRDAAFDEAVPRELRGVPTTPPRAAYGRLARDGRGRAGPHPADRPVFPPAVARLGPRLRHRSPGPGDRPRGDRPRPPPGDGDGPARTSSTCPSSTPRIRTTMLSAWASPRRWSARAAKARAGRATTATSSNASAASRIATPSSADAIRWTSRPSWTKAASRGDARTAGGPKKGSGCVQAGAIRRSEGSHERALPHTRRFRADPLRAPVPGPAGRHPGQWRAARRPHGHGDAGRLRPPDALRPGRRAFRC